MAPLYIAVAPDEPRLLFVVERGGRIRALRDEVTLPNPFLDISGLITAGGERGLFSVAFPPDYASSRRFYVAFTNLDGDIELDEFMRSESDATLADPSTRRVVLIVPRPDPAVTNHNGGQLQFGPKDGYLYMSTGDGGNVFPRGEPARDIENLLGKILRIKPLPSASGPYGIPQSNPFVGRPGRDEIFAYGLRNPWRFSFDGRRIAIADVGWTKHEEINFLNIWDASGANFGWPQYEGNILLDNSRPGPDPPTFPSLVYDHGGGRCAIIGGYVVRNPSLPRLDRRYIYGDLCTGEVRSFLAYVPVQRVLGDRPTGITLPNLSAFGQGFNGEIYAAQISGSVWRLAQSPP